MNALILANGEPPPLSLFEKIMHWADLFIAADGGANIARSMGHLPDVVIGDLDSYKQPKEEPYEVIRNPDQETNDLEKAIAFAQTKGATHVKVLGATGRRLDHTLKNLSVLKQFDNHFKELTFLDAQGITFLLPVRFSKELPAGTTVSLFPLSGKVSGITTQGLKYALNNESLENGVRDGSSNTVTSSPVTIHHKKGDLLLFIAK